MHTSKAVIEETPYKVQSHRGWLYVTCDGFEWHIRPGDVQEVTLDDIPSSKLKEGRGLNRRCSPRVSFMRKGASKDVCVWRCDVLAQASEQDIQEVQNEARRRRDELLDAISEAESYEEQRSGMTMGMGFAVPSMMQGVLDRIMGAGRPSTDDARDGAPKPPADEE